MIKTGESMRKTLQAWVPGFAPEEYLNAINRSYDDLSRMYPWTKLEREFKLVTKQYIDTGRVHFTNGTSTITAGGSISAGWSTGESDGFAGMFIKKNEQDEANYYVITASDSVSVTITENYIGKTTTAVASAGDAYFIFQHIYSVPSAIETVTFLMGRTLLDEIDRYRLELRNPDFDWEGEPRAFNNYGVNSANVALVQIYPPKIDDVYELRGWGRLKIEELTESSSPLLDSNLIMAYGELELMKRKRMINPDSISDDMLKNSEMQAERKLMLAMQLDDRQRTHMPYTQDNMFRSGHPGQKWLVSHDPWTYGLRSYW